MTLSPSLRFQHAAQTHPGKVRTVNEDSVLARAGDGLWAVADGMGGHVNGRWASTAIAKALEQIALPGGFDAGTEAVAQAIYAANEEIRAEGRELGASMGSTVVALLIKEARFAALWAGDSRVYLYRDGGLHQLTTDHTQVQEMVDSGLLTAEEAEDHPMAHVLSRAVGVGAGLQIDAVADEAMPGDVFLLCSDGLTRTVSDRELSEVLAAGGPQSATARLLDLALARGAPDNVTVVVVACEATTLLVPS